jgi:hypothetical protein
VVDLPPLGIKVQPQVPDTVSGIGKEIQTQKISPESLSSSLEELHFPKCERPMRFLLNSIAVGKS